MADRDQGEETRERRSASRWADNPIYIRLIRDDRPLSVRAAIILAALIGLVGLVSSSLWVAEAMSQQPGSALPDSLFRSTILCVAPMAVMLGWLVLAMGPLAVAATAANQTASDVQSEAFQLVRLTELSERRVRLGYLLAAFHRRRLLLALAVTLAPSALLGFMGLMSTASIITTIMKNLPPPTGMDIIGPLAELTAMVIGQLLLNVIGGVLGVRLALWADQRRLMVGAVAPGVMLIVSAAGVIVALIVLGPYIGGARFSDIPSAWQGLATVVGLCVVVPLGLATALVWPLR